MRCPANQGFPARNSKPLIFLIYRLSVGFRENPLLTPNALDHQADIAKVQEWLGHANIATTRIYDHRRTRPEDTARPEVTERAFL